MTPLLDQALALFLLVDNASLVRFGIRRVDYGRLCHQARKRNKSCCPVPKTSVELGINSHGSPKNKEHICGIILEGIATKQLLHVIRNPVRHDIKLMRYRVS